MASRAAMLLDPRSCHKRIEANGNSTKSPLCRSHNQMTSGGARDGPLAPRCLAPPDHPPSDLVPPNPPDQFHTLIKGASQSSTGRFNGGQAASTPVRTASISHLLPSPRTCVSPPQKPRTQKSSNPINNPRSDVQSTTEITPTVSEVEFKFPSGDLADGNKNVLEKRGSAEADNPRVGHGSLIEEMYNVQKRQAQPQKRIKIVRDGEVEKASLRRSTLDISGDPGFSNWVREDNGNPDMSDTVSTAIVDLTNDIEPKTGSSGDDDLLVTGSNDLRTQRVCYGKIERAMVQAHIVPRPNVRNGFGNFTHDWPSIRLGIDREQGVGYKIGVSDPHGRVFGSIDSKTASALVPLLDSPALNVEITARLDVRKRFEGENPWQSCSANYHASINIYGLRKDAHLVGKHLGQSNVWLSSPNMVEPGIPVFNPHAEKRRALESYAPNPYTRNRMPVNYEIRTAEEVNDAVIKMFDQLKSAENLPELEPSSLISTPLLRHQRQALWFMTEKEKPRKFGLKEEDNNSLWRIEYQANGRKRYREIISGTIVNEEPLQTLGGLLADMMGLGKTLSILSLIISSLPESRKWETMTQLPELVRNSPEIRNTRVTLLVCPLSAVSNWVAQIGEHLQRDAVLYYVFHGPSRTTNVDELSKYDLVITTYHTILSELSGRNSKRGISPLTKMNMFRIVLDEAHTIREQGAAQTQAIFKLNSDRRWSVTGTPIQNRLEDLVSVTKFLRLFPYDDKSRFSAYILSRFKTGDANVLASLRVLVDSFTLRRVKDKINLPPRHDKIITLNFSENEKQLHEFFRRESNVMMKVIASDGKTKMGGKMYHHVLKAMMILRQVSAHGKELLDKENRDRVKGMSVQDAIDLEDGEEGYQLDVADKKAYEMFTLMRESSADVCAKCGKTLDVKPTETDAFDKQAPIAVMFPCFDVLCIDCFAAWKQAFDLEPRASSQGIRCLVCDGYMPAVYFSITPAGFDEYWQTQAQATRSRKQVKTLGEYEGPHTKTKALLSHLLDTEDENRRLRSEKVRPIKSVVFSAWTSHLDLIEIALKDNGIMGHSRLDGTMPLYAREKALEEFRDNETVTVLLATIGAGGVGLNLTSASKVYVMEPQYNPAAIAQAVDRIHRLGQKREVTAIQFIMKDSIEEKILELARKKQQLADMSMSRGKLDRKELQEARMREYRSLFK